MANPQTEIGHNCIANELLEAIAFFDFSKQQYKVLLAVIRKTYGFHKKEDEFTSAQLARMTRLDEAHCRWALRELADFQALKVSKTAHGQTVAFNKNYELWQAETARTKYKDKERNIPYCIPGNLF